MNDKLDTLLGQMRQLEREIVEETHRKGEQFCFTFKDRKAHFTEAAKTEHRRLRTGLHHYLLHSRFLVVITSPVIWMCAVPVLLSDLVASVYQAICFPIYGIPKVRRSEYIAFDRHRLTYLNLAEKLNCEYCAYANGILAYFTEIAARTEQHCCLIKHANCSKCAHSRYKKFVDFGDAEGYREHVEQVRRAYDDLESPAAAPGEPGTPDGPAG